jgi:DNA mismatch repair ATPase MutS
LYIAELARARQLLAMAGGGQRATYIIDEIFRGTNHLESVSAAAAVLDVLATHDMVLVSSHNLVLASLLEHRLAPFCVALDEDGMLTLAPGFLAHTNGIALLAQRGFGGARRGAEGAFLQA